MLDKDYIEEIRVLDKKEAKAKLDEYASQFSIKLNKTKSFDNMLIDLEVELQKLADEPMPETTGLSIADLIEADDAATGKSVFIEEVKPEAQLLIDSVSNSEPVKIVDVQDIDPGFKVETPAIRDEGFVIATESISDEGFTAEIDLSVPAGIQIDTPAITISDKFKLPDNFSPNLHLMGRSPGYATLPWWIYQWIEATPDWKSRPYSFEHASAHQTLLSLIYYINRDGSVMIRETRNSSFITLS